MGKIDVDFAAGRNAVPAGEKSDLDVVIRITPEVALSTEPRRKVRLGITIDRSGSMRGTKLDYALEASRYIVNALESGDQVGIVTYDDEVTTVSPMTDISEKEALLDRINTIRFGGRTALHAGWVQGGVVVADGLDSESLNRVILLSDGLANVGQTDPGVIVEDVAQLSGHGVSTTAVGVGRDYNEHLLSEMARAGDGNYWFIQSPEQLPTIFDQELDGLIATVGRQATLVLKTESGVSVKRVLNNLSVDGEGRYKLPNLISGSTFEVIVRLTVDRTKEAAATEVPLFTAVLEWLDRDEKKTTTERSFGILEVQAEQMGEYPEDESVREQVMLMDGARIKREAMEFVRTGRMDDANVTLDGLLAKLKAGAQTANIVHEMKLINSLKEEMTRDRVLAMKRGHYSSHGREYGSVYGEVFFKMGGRAVVGDIAAPPDTLGVPVEAIVNSTDRNITAGGAISRAILHAGGHELMRACREAGMCETGGAVITPGFDLPVDWVIHTVAPNYHGHPDEEGLLRACYFSCLDKAVKQGISTIAFPAIGIGGRGFPVRVAARVAVNAVGSYLAHNPRFGGVLFVCPNDEVKRIYDEAMFRLHGR